MTLHHNATVAAHPPTPLVDATIQAALDAALAGRPEATLGTTTVSTIGAPPFGATLPGATFRMEDDPPSPITIDVPVLQPDSLAGAALTGGGAHIGTLALDTLRGANAPEANEGLLFRFLDVASAMR